MGENLVDGAAVDFVLKGEDSAGAAVRDVGVLGLLSRDGRAGGVAGADGGGGRKGRKGSDA